MGQGVNLPAPKTYYERQNLFWKFVASGFDHRADEVMILDKGKVSEYGDRKKLAADPNSRFYQLVQTGMEEVLA